MKNYLLFALFLFQFYLSAPYKGLAEILNPETQKSEFIVERRSLKNQFQIHTVERWRHETYDRKPLTLRTPLTSFAAFNYFLQKFITQQKKLITLTPWLGSPLSMSDLQASTTQLNYIEPFVLKHAAPAGTIVYFWGDLHGDVESVSNSFYRLYQDKVIDNNFTIIKPNCLFFFLGDMVDRGQHCVDTLTLLFIFSCQNPDKVFLIRGNHEDISMNKQKYYHDDKNLTHFYRQLEVFYDNQVEQEKINTFEEFINSIAFFYNTLPVAAFVGCNNNYMQCCHGGLEVRYNPQELLRSAYPICLQAIEKLSLPWENPQAKFKELQIDIQCQQNLRTIPKNSIKTFDLGFLWNDFNAYKFDEMWTYCQEGRGFVMGKLLTQEIFKNYSGTCTVKGIIRAHQHNETMPGVINPVNTGIFTLWDNLVITTIATSAFSGLTAFISLTLQNDFEKWDLKNYNYDPKYLRWQARENKLTNWRNIVA